MSPLMRIEPAGGTNIATGLMTSERLLASERSRVRRVILLSDGLDDSSAAIRVADRMKANGIVIDCVGVGERRSIDEECLKRIASTIRGSLRYHFVDDAEELYEHFEEIATGLVRIP